MKTLKFMLAAATAIGIASVAQAGQNRNASTGFEKLPQGTKVITGIIDNKTGDSDISSYFCYAGANVDDNESEIVAFTDNATPVTRPTGITKFDGADATSRANALQVSTGTDPLLRTFRPVANSAPQAGEEFTTSTYIDTLVQFTVTPSTDTVAPGGNDKLMIYLKETVKTDLEGNPTGETATNLVVMAGFLKADYTVTPKEFVLTKDGIKPGVWYRLTVEAVPAVLDAAVVSGAIGFKIKLDNEELQTGDATFVEDEDLLAVISESEKVGSGIVDGAVFLSLLTGEAAKCTLQAVGFAGEGLVDDLIVTDVDPAVRTVNFTLAFDENKVTAIGYTIGDTPYWETDKLVEEVAEGSVITINSITYADGYEFDSFTTTGLTAAGDNKFTVNGETAASLSINAKSSASAGYPEYIPAEDATVKGLYDAWKANVAGEGDVNAAQNQFLLNTAASNEAAAGDATLKITSIAQNASGGWDIVVGCTVEGVKLTGSVDSYQVCNGYLAIEYASELGAAAWTKENIAVSAVDAEAGTVTVNVNKPEAKFLKAELSLTKAPTVE